MKKLYILFDGECELCRRCRFWLMRQPSYVTLVFCPFQSPEAECRFPGLRDLHPDEELVVISDEGDVWQGESAWVMCLWALCEYREWSQRLASPVLLPLARRLCDVVSANRHALSQWLDSDPSNEEVRSRLEAMPAPACGNDGYCKAR